MNPAGLPAQLSEFPALLSEHYSELSSYVDLLANEGITWGLVGPNERNDDRLWNRHVLNSLAIQELLPADCQVIDVGSGAGLPGIPLAIVRPDLEMTLLEPKQRGVNFLELALDRLSLSDRVKVVRSRAEDHHGSYPAVICRAVANLERLLAWCWPLVAPQGSLISLKGESAPAEAAAAADTLSQLAATAEIQQLPVPGTSEHTWAVIVRKTLSCQQLTSTLPQAPALPGIPTTREQLKTVLDDSRRQIKEHPETLMTVEEARSRFRTS
jgi:16S rRNA (guanine527-N7)-methyltransferase